MHAEKSTAGSTRLANGVTGDANIKRRNEMTIPGGPALRIVAGVAIVFGLLTILSGGRALFGSEDGQCGALCAVVQLSGGVRLYRRRYRAVFEASAGGLGINLHLCQHVFGAVGIRCLRDARRCLRDAHRRCDDPASRRVDVHFHCGMEVHHANTDWRFKHGLNPSNWLCPDSYSIADAASKLLQGLRRPLSCCGSSIGIGRRMVSNKKTRRLTAAVPAQPPQKLRRKLWAR